MDRQSVQQKIPKEEKPAAPRSSKGKKGKKSKGTRNEEQRPQMKVVYISNPMRVTTTASEFKDRVQELTGRHADVADIFFNSSSDHAYGSGAGTAGPSPGTATAGYYSPCSSSSHEDAVATPASADASMAEAGDLPPASNQAVLMGHHHLDQWRGGGPMHPEDEAPLFKPLTVDGSADAYYGDTLDSHLLGNNPLAPAAAGMQPPSAHHFESPLADVFRRFADGRP